MFDRLLASRPPRDGARRPWLVSLLAHAMLLAGAVSLTRAATALVRPAGRVPEPPPFFLPRTTPVPLPATSGTPGSTAPAPRIRLAPPDLGGPDGMPTAIAIAPPAVPGADLPTRRQTGVPVIHVPLAIGRSTPDTMAVDIPVAPLDGPTPDYPPALRAAGIEGTVRLRFVVTATGLVDSASVRVVRMTRAEFVAPAIATIRAWRFSPAIRRGRPVPQMVEQNVRFRLER